MTTIRFEFVCRACGRKVVYRDSKHGYQHLADGLCNNGSVMAPFVRSIRKEYQS